MEYLGLCGPYAHHAGKENQMKNIALVLVGLGILLTLRCKKSEFIFAFLSEGE